MSTHTVRLEGVPLTMTLPGPSVVISMYSTAVPKKHSSMHNASKIDER